AVKRIAGEPVEVEAHCFCDGHDSLRVMLCWRAETETTATETEMVLDNNDEWRGRFTPPIPGRYRYQVSAWVDHFRSWRHEFARRVEPDDVRIALRSGASIVDEHAARAPEADRATLTYWATRLRGAAMQSRTDDAEKIKSLALDEVLAAIADRYPDRSLATRSSVELPLVADRVRARFSAWYEMFPRSAVDTRHGTFADVEARLPYIAGLGFDVLYFPPIHPIGREKRKGRNNALVATPEDVGSPWAIGAAEGGHKDILPELGTADDFRRLVAAAAAVGIELALDIAFQCAPDHPYVRAHPDWFRWRPDQTIQFAENPPKQYQDIYPFNFETKDWRGLWNELKSVFEHWIGLGVRIFRVDNPHTKAFAFWEWVIGEIKAAYPDVLFLSEAFTRPKVMHRLAKLGFSQSYTYFTWRNTRPELEAYFTELAQGPGRDYFRPNVWPNTPDILSEPLHEGHRASFSARLVLAATLSSSYGIYGPAYELLEHRPRSPGSEEYLDSEKYQLRQWDLSQPNSLAPLISRINRIRRDNAALHANDTLRFVHCDNPLLIAYTKVDVARESIILTVVNLDPHYAQSGWLELNPEIFESPGDTHPLHDLLSDQWFLWQGTGGFVILDPTHAPAHVFRLHRRLRSENDFDNLL
ncbi:MAG: alpha-1,4-glucan--maltose-1-phosphate maltosyltransferase, partial [Betaproteobacteria bacterium]